MKKWIVSVCIMFGVVGQALAWGQNGHRVVGLVAQEHLNQKAKKRINTLLLGNSLAEVSVWMDDIRSDKHYDHTHDWHWVTIPKGMSYEQSTKNKNGDLIMKIEEIVSLLKARSLSPMKEQEALKILVHLVGDLHQPLHVSQLDDKGGNDVKLAWFGRNSSLHRVWDSDMIESKDLSFTEMAIFLDKPDKSMLKMLQSGTVRDWAGESQQLLPDLYQYPENKKLGYQYLYQHWPLVEQQLLKAGIRLAALLNEIYG